MTTGIREPAAELVDLGPRTHREIAQTLHRLVYLAAIPVAVHFILPSCG